MRNTRPGSRIRNYNYQREHKAQLEQRERQVLPVTREKLACQDQLDQMDILGQRGLLDMVGSQENMAVMGQREHGERKEERERWASWGSL